MIDFKDFKFIAKTGEGSWHFIGETKLTADCTSWESNTRIKDGWGMFQGKTMSSYMGYLGELPRSDQDSASFEEFDIYYNNELIEENKTYSEILSIIRDNTINKILE